jgi:hypothetical protein
MKTLHYSDDFEYVISAIRVKIRNIQTAKVISRRHPTFEKERKYEKTYYDTKNDIPLF